MNRLNVCYVMFKHVSGMYVLNVNIMMTYACCPQALLCRVTAKAWVCCMYAMFCRVRTQCTWCSLPILNVPCLFLFCSANPQDLGVQCAAALLGLRTWS
jgi:hypothetical protein